MKTTGHLKAPLWAEDSQNSNPKRKRGSPLNVFPSWSLGTRWALIAVILPVVLVSLPLSAAPGQSADPLAESASWQPPPYEEVRKQVFKWLDRQAVDAATRAKAVEIWPADADDEPQTELLLQLAEVVALSDKNARRLVELCSHPREGTSLASQDWLTDPQTEPLLSNNLRLLYGRWLAQESLFDEAGEQLAGLQTEEVVDPASLLFYQGVVHHRLLDRESGLESIKQLLARAEANPRRYTAVARLMQADLERLEDDSLDHIARRMDDVRRRLDLGRAGTKVRKIEDGVIESLDKLIEEMEKQQKQSSASAGGNMQSGSPMPDSRIAGGKGRGEVTKRDIGDSSGWGDLPPKKREEALQQIGRQFPAHYRDVIQQYFRKLASEGSQK